MTFSSWSIYPRSIEYRSSAVDPVYFFFGMFVTVSVLGTDTCKICREFIARISYTSAILNNCFVGVNLNRAVWAEEMLI